MTAAAAQDDTRREGAALPGELPTCRGASATRTEAGCVEAPAVLRAEQEFTRTLELAVPKTLQCEISIELEYYQRDTVARFNGVIENDTCGASSGEYEIQVELRDREGRSERLVFSESWQRDDDRPVAISADYPIGENVELTRLRALRPSCTCDSDEEAGAAGP